MFADLRTHSFFSCIKYLANGKAPFAGKVSGVGHQWSTEAVISQCAELKVNFTFLLNLILNMTLQILLGKVLVHGGAKVACNSDYW